MFDQKTQALPPKDLPQNNNQSPVSSDALNQPTNEPVLPTIADVAATKSANHGANLPSQPQTSGAGSQPVEDIFAKTDQADGSNVDRPIQPGGASHMPNDPASDSAIYGGKPTWPKKVLMAILALVVIAVVVSAGWWAFKYFSARLGGDGADQGQSENANINKNNNQSANLNNRTDTNSGQAEIVSPDSQKAVVLPTDTDSDGLSDAREIELGTDVYSVDTDKDGLSDWAEISVYSTDPLNPDTDGDSYLDGNEVINNYDPNRPGSARLYNIPR